VTDTVQQHCRKYTDQVLLVSMDGFRWDYVNKVDTPNFDRMAREGSKAQYINNTFTTKTFPCHYTIVTGKNLTVFFLYVFAWYFNLLIIYFNY